MRKKIGLMIAAFARCPRPRRRPIGRRDRCAWWFPTSPAARPTRSAGSSADALSSAFGQQFFIENRAGGGGLIASEAVARAGPDGYTLIVSGIPSHVFAPAMSKSVTFDTVRDFTHIAYFGGPPNVFVVHSSAGIRTFQDFLVRAKAEKDGVQYVSPGVGSSGNLVAEFFAAKEGIKMTHVAYRGGAGAILDLVAGQVKMGSLALSTALQHIRAGTLIPLAISSAERLPELPDVPTMKELGYPDLVTLTWFSLSAPAGLLKDIVGRINREIAKALNRPEIQKHLQQETVQTRAMTPEEVTEFIGSEVAKWTPVVKATVKTQ